MTVTELCSVKWFFRCISIAATSRRCSSPIQDGWQWPWKWCGITFEVKQGCTNEFIVENECSRHWSHSFACLPNGKFHFLPSFHNGRYIQTYLSEAFAGSTRKQRQERRAQETCSCLKITGKDLSGRTNTPSQTFLTFDQHLTCICRGKSLHRVPEHPKRKVWVISTQMRAVTMKIHHLLLLLITELL